MRTSRYDFSGSHKYEYIQRITKSIKATAEIYILSQTATQSDSFSDLGITDSLLLELSKECRLLITADSKLSDYAAAYGVLVYDIVKNRNERL